MRGLFAPVTTANEGPYARLVQAQELHEGTAPQNNRDNNMVAVSGDVEKVGVFGKDVPSPSR